MVGSRLGYNCIGVDINPVMATFAAAKTLDVLAHGDELIDFFSTFKLRRGDHVAPHFEGDPLAETFESQSALFIRSVLDEIEKFEHEHGEASRRSIHDGLSAISDRSRIVESNSAFLFSVLFRTVRENVPVTDSSNPTWQKALHAEIKLDPKRIRDDLVRNAHNMILDLADFYKRSEKTVDHLSLVGDVRTLPIGTGTVDYVITSPPYLTRIDYAVSTSIEQSILSAPKLVEDIRHRQMGTTVITKGEKKQSKAWGPTCNGILDAVKSHPTKAAGTYYWKNMVQYFSDLEASIVEIRRVLSARGKALVVVQSSFFKEVEIPLGQVVIEMANQAGFSARIAFRDEVRAHMAHVNTKSNSYKANKVYFEDTVLIEK